MWFSVLILSCEHSNEDLKWRAVLSRWNPLTCDHSNESHRALLQSYCLLCCTSWFEILSLWMNSLSGTCSQVKVSDRYFSLLLSAVGGGFERLGSLWNHGVIQTLLQFKSTVWIPSLSRLHVLSRAMHTIHTIQQEHEFNHEQIYILICLTASHVKGTSICQAVC